MKLSDVLDLQLMHRDTQDSVETEVAVSLSHRGSKRFELKTENGEKYIRACFGRSLMQVSFDSHVREI